MCFMGYACILNLNFAKPCIPGNLPDFISIKTEMAYSGILCMKTSIFFIQVSKGDETVFDEYTVKVFEQHF